jgi:hypothetical protein
MYEESMKKHIPSLAEIKGDVKASTINRAYAKELMKQKRKGKKRKDIKCLEIYSAK